MTSKDYVDSKPNELKEIKDIEKNLQEYQKLMQEAASNLEFETAIYYREKIKELEIIRLKK